MVHGMPTSAPARGIVDGIRHVFDRDLVNPTQRTRRHLERRDVPIVPVEKQEVLDEQCRGIVRIRQQRSEVGSKSFRMSRHRAVGLD